MIGLAEFMYRINKNGNVVGINIRINTMTQIEHMATTRAISGKNGSHLISYSLSISIQDSSIHVALDGNTVSESMSDFSQVYRPVYTNGITSCCRNILQPATTTFGK